MNDLNLHRFIPIVEPGQMLAVASSYTHDPKELDDFHKFLRQKIRNYGGDFGPMMLDHMERVANHYAVVLSRAGYDEQTVENLRQATLFHDIGKILQSETLWNLGRKPTTQEKEERKAHVWLGGDVILKSLNFFDDLKGHPHIGLMVCIQQYHHERIHGKGPMRLQDRNIHEAIELLGIIDTVDGKSMLRGAELTLSPEDQQKIRQEKYIAALNEITGDPQYTAEPKKHAGEFRLENLKAVLSYFSDIFGKPALQPLRAHASGLDPRPNPQ